MLAWHQPCTKSQGCQLWVSYFDTILNPLSCQPEGYAAAKEKEFWPTQAAWQLLPNPQTNAGISTQQMQNNAEKKPHKPSVSHTKHAR
jgi:hypothetical protein